VKKQAAPGDTRRPKAIDYLAVVHSAVAEPAPSEGRISESTGFHSLTLFRGFDCPADFFVHPSPFLFHAPNVCFDESHFGGFVSDHLCGICFFKIHPSLSSS
jgi:hypothetical protein